VVFETAHVRFLTFLTFLQHPKNTTFYVF